MMKKGVRLLNFARGGLVVNKDVIAAIDAGKIAQYITDFTDEELLANDKVICLPHLGASTPEAEDNCAFMAVKQLKDFLERGNIVNSVNFPKTYLDAQIPAGGTRLCIANKNVPNMVGQISTILADAKLNIEGMVNQNRADLAYNLIDVSCPVTDDVVAKLKSIEGVINVRCIAG
jgi:D-3-phosphoglycerate dehydrogenase